jgi:HSP20 family protein
MSRREQQPSGAIEPRRRGQLARAEGMPTFNPFSMIRRIAEDMDRMFEGVGLPGLRGLGLQELETFTPKIDIFKQDGKLVVRADLPGVDLDDITVEISNDSLVIEGERTYEHEEDEEGVYRVERGSGHFRREIPLPEGVKPDTATATFKNGVLEIAMEAPEMEQHRRIEVKSEEQAQQPQQAQTQSEQGQAQSEQAQTPSEGETKAERPEQTEEKGPKAA